MAKFYVGQRVRVIASSYLSECRQPGATGRIVSSYARHSVFGVRMDQGAPDDSNGDGWSFHSDELEPLPEQAVTASQEGVDTV